MAGRAYAMLLLCACLLLSQPAVALRGAGFRPTNGPISGTNLANQWGIKYLQIIRSGFPNFSPPVVGRNLAMFTTAMYDAWTAYDKKALPVYAENEFRVAKGWTAADLDASIAYATYCTVVNVTVSLSGAFSGLKLQADTFMQDLGYDIADTNTDRENPIGLGNAVCQVVLKNRYNDGFNQGGNNPNSATPGRAYGDYTNYFPVNLPQTLPGLTDCALQMRSLNRWQPMFVEFGDLPGWQAGNVQNWLSPHAGSAQMFSLPISSLYRPTGPPKYGNNSVTSAEYVRQAQQVLTLSGQLTDTTKMIAEFWADGPDSTLPPGHWHQLAVAATVKNNLDIENTIKLMFLQGQAVMDAGIACWEAKRFYDSVRPLQMIQCLWKNTQVQAWVGPYRGTGMINASWWQPYQDRFFITPPFGGYVSGHSSFSSASAFVLRSFLNSDTYLGETYTCAAGQSLFEPEITDPSQPAYVAGLTDVPNSGPGTPGYTPANDVTLSWATWSEAAEQAGSSRLLGGIHIEADNVDGLALGEKIGNAVWVKASALFDGERRDVLFDSECTGVKSAAAGITAVLASWLLVAAAL